MFSKRGDFWEVETEEISAAIEREVYRAVREFLTVDDPDTMLYWLSVTDDNDPKKLSLLLTIEGRGAPNIERRFDFASILASELESLRDSSGMPRLDLEDRAELEAMKDGFQLLINQIEHFLREIPNRREHAS